MCSGCTFIHCSSCYGGGLYFSPSTAQRLSGSVFRNGKASFHGGGLYWKAIVENSKICGCLFTDNIGTESGHDVYLSPSCSKPFDSYCFTLTNQSKRVAVNNSTSDEYDLWLLYSPFRTISQISTGTVCTSVTESRCTTLLEAYEDDTPFSDSSSLTIFLLNTSHTKDTSTLSINNYYTTITSYDWESPSTLIISSSFSGTHLLKVSGGFLLLVLFTISLQTSSAGVWNLTGGKLSVMDMIIMST